MSLSDWIFITAVSLTAVPIICMLVLLLLSPCGDQSSVPVSDKAGFQV